jgi:nucleoside phosphorylase
VNTAARREARALPPPIYLHFLDRELGQAFEFRLNLQLAHGALSALALGTASTLFCSMSALMENEGLESGLEMIEDLVSSDILLPQSTHPTLSTFLESRREMYEHDQARYPRYFGGSLDGLAGLEPRYVPGSTTERLHERLVVWAGGVSTIPAVNSLPTDVRRRMEDTVAEELRRREKKAITYAMFAAVLVGDPSGKVVERTVRQRISIEYTDHQRSPDGQLATGVGLALEPLERVLQPEWPFERDVPIVRALLGSSGLAPMLSGWPRTLWQSILPLRGRPGHIGLVSRIQWISRALDTATSGPGARELRRQQAVSAIKAATASTGPIAAGDPEDLLVAAQRNLDGLAARLASRGFQAHLERHADALEPLEADVLLIVATDIEEICTLREFGFPPGTSPRRHPRGQQIYLELGTFAGQMVFLVRSEMGSAGAGGSQFTADDAIAALRPDWALMLGIAFGVDPTKQSIGDVLVPEEIVFYDHKRVGTDKGGGSETKYRDAPARPDAALLKRLRDSKRDFGQARVEFGRLLSGSELIDNDEHRRLLVERAANGDAIGGEMELRGVFDAANRRGGRWGAAKAICDFADGGKKVEKRVRQERAATNAARFVRHTIEKGLLGSVPD